jgi:hypothetical protein
VVILPSVEKNHTVEEVDKKVDGCDCGHKDGVLC